MMTRSTALRLAWTTPLWLLALACTGVATDSGSDSYGPEPTGNMCDPDTPEATCGDEQSCELWEGNGAYYCMCPEGTEQVGRECYGEGEDNLKPTCSTLEEDACDDEGFCYDLTQEACDYMTERDIPTPSECDVIEPSGENDTIGICVSSTQDPSANPYAPDAGYCEFTQQWSNPTHLPVDCRCGQPFEVSECKRPYGLDASISFGEGPRWRSISTFELFGADLDGREMIVAGSWESSTLDDQGVVFAVDLDTGDRRVVSGSFQDPSLGTYTEGSGPDFVNAYNVRLAADGDYYVVGATGQAGAPYIWRVDPDSGDRELIWQGRSDGAFAPCANGVPESEVGTKEINYDPMSWTMDDAGYHYFGVLAGAPGPGVVRVSPDGETCDYLTRIVQDPDSTFDDVGDGYSDIQFYFSALEIVDDTMYALSDRQIYTIEMDTGRRRLFSDAESGTVGSGTSSLGKTWLTWDPHHDVLWSYGSPSNDNILVAIDPDTGDRTSAPCWHPYQGMLEGCAGNSVGIGGVMSMGGMVVDPEAPHDLFNAFDDLSVIQTDQATLNINIHSL